MVKFGGRVNAEFLDPGGLEPFFFQQFMFGSFDKPGLKAFGDGQREREGFQNPHQFARAAITFQNIIAVVAAIGRAPEFGGNHQRNGVRPFADHMQAA